ncbi:hypothetical protein HO173_009969 [Letharia columbiana]|uniref:DUF1760-domain-containing protein n=1 Tax=Letharia columbiana TaxID=112416 RepID=A0A8H6L1C9_9LECA|nr:uncharacterized protein HO173_009969 [Letharia columbiana]KAF6231886.1 hypothetical protein HO173_009969 [Letharia columbiana]
MADSENPLLKALPPETDYLSYLTILEYNLTAEQLPTLHDILQDTTLTANIGWDLVHLLLPLLPASHQCIQDVARLGNPREVVLKVTELLEAFGEEEEAEDEEESEDIEELEKLKEPGVSEDDAREDDVQDGENVAAEFTTSEGPSRPPSKGVKFTALLEMLSVLHPRIKTKYPSRFLSTSLQAILPAYSQVARTTEATEAVLGFIKALSGTRRPKLPPRKSSVMIPTQATPVSAPDPEGQDEALGVDEKGLQSRLLQSFLTYVTEAYMSSTALDEDVPGLAWSSRYQEELHPEKIIPGRRTYGSLFVEEEHLHERDTITGHILSLARDLKLGAEELLSTITKPDELDLDEEQELPSSASDVPLSKTGSMFILATMAASSTLFDAPASLPSLSLVPDFAGILASSLGDSATGSTGAESEPLIDAVLFLGFLIIGSQPNVPAGADNDHVFNNVLQRLSLLSANMPSPVLRYHAHLLTSTILHLNPSEDSRLAFIRDTLEHCPFENLKASAIGWLKDEILAAEKAERSKDEPDAEDSIFATSAALNSLAPFIFPNPEKLMEGQSITGSYATFQAHQPFYLAVLNLLYLLLSSTTLSSRLQMAEVAKQNELPRFLDSLLQAAKKFQSSLSNDELEYGDEQGRNDGFLVMELMEMAVGQAQHALSKVGMKDLEA